MFEEFRRYWYLFAVGHAGKWEIIRYTGTSVEDALSNNQTFCTAVLLSSERDDAKTGTAFNVTTKKIVVVTEIE